MHAADVVKAVAAFHENPRSGAVYNLGGGRESNISMLEAIEACQRIAGRELQWDLIPEARIGDHRWWISDLQEFKTDYPGWSLSFGVEDLLREIYTENAELWEAERAAAGRG